MIYGLLFLFFSALAFWAARYFSRELRRTRDWPTVPGRILERGVGEPMGSGRTYMPRVRYAYRVDGKEYTGDQVYVIRRTGNLPDAVQKLVDSLPDPLTVHYNPRDPTQTWLIANPWGMFWLLLAVGLLALFLGVGQILVALAPTSHAGSSPVPKAPWLVTYSDGSANGYRFWRDSEGKDAHFEYSPVQPKESSTGMYSGGQPANGVLKPEQVEGLWQRIVRLESDTKLHAAERMKGTGAFALKAPSGSRKFIIKDGPALVAWNQFLSSFRRGKQGLILPPK